MPGEYLPLSEWQVGLAAGLLLINGVISVALRLNLGRQIFIAGLRTVIQLALIGFLLQGIFSVQRLDLVLIFAFAMTLIAGIAASQRVTIKYRSIWLDGIVAMWISSWFVSGVAVSAIVRPAPWYAPQYLIPLLGMVLGNTLNGISLGFDRFTSELSSKRDEVECLLAMGASSWEAAMPSIREAVRTGMIPIINSMTVVGIVSLPGMMTGQILAGQSPAEAVKYQIVIMFLIASGTGLGTTIAVLLSYKRQFTAHHQIRREG